MYKNDIIIYSFALPDTLPTFIRMHCQLKPEQGGIAYAYIQDPCSYKETETHMPLQPASTNFIAIVHFVYLLKNTIKHHISLKHDANVH